MTINIKDIFQNKSLPIIILDKNNKPLKNFEYRYLNRIDSYRRYRYVVTKRINRN
jgi:Lon protease-like protein